MFAKIRSKKYIWVIYTLTCIQFQCKNAFTYFTKNHTLETAGHEMACLKHAISLSFETFYIKDNKTIFKK